MIYLSKDTNEGDTVRCGNGKVLYSLDAIIRKSTSSEILGVKLTNAKTGKTTTKYRSWTRDTFVNKVEGEIKKTDREATHNGHCQVCGRQHAADNKTHRLADHGYRVIWNSHVGVCYGARHLPVELDVTILDKTVADCDRQATRLENITADEITEVSQRVRVGFGKHKKVTVDRADWDEWRASEDGVAYYGDPSGLYASTVTWADRAAKAVGECRRTASQIRQHIELLKRLRERHGSPLLARP